MAIGCEASARSKTRIIILESLKVKVRLFYFGFLKLSYLILVNFHI